jgi:hypothetical protein
MRSRPQLFVVLQLSFVLVLVFAEVVTYWVMEPVWLFQLQHGDSIDRATKMALVYGFLYTAYLAIPLGIAVWAFKRGAVMIEQGAARGPRYSWAMAVVLAAVPVWRLLGAGNGPYPSVMRALWWPLLLNVGLYAAFLALAWWQYRRRPAAA